jgi:hypothetical protein
MASAISEPHKPPDMAKPRFWSVYERVIPPMVKVWREPTAKACFVADVDRRRLGTTTPAMNKLMVIWLKSWRTERAFCILVLPLAFAGGTVGWC